MRRSTEKLEQFIRTTAPDHDAIQAEMAAYADREGFPIVGPVVGGVLRLLARVSTAESVFEFGSGFGYSAYWFLLGMESTGHVVLTEFDEEELDMARSFFDRAGLSDRATFELGDAMEAIERYDGPFDIVLIDHQKHRYVDAFEAAESKVPVGGVIVADNVIRGPIDFDVLFEHVHEGNPLPDDESDAETAGIGRYLDRVMQEATFETTILPVGSGIAISTRIE
ncbi:MAG: O-methyltransferase [Halobacteriota archaeon]